MREDGEEMRGDLDINIDWRSEKTVSEDACGEEEILQTQKFDGA